MKITCSNLNLIYSDWLFSIIRKKRSIYLREFSELNLGQIAISIVNCAWPCATNSPFIARRGARSFINDDWRYSKLYVIEVTTVKIWYEMTTSIYFPIPSISHAQCMKVIVTHIFWVPSWYHLAVECVSTYYMVSWSYTWQSSLPEGDTFPHALFRVFMCIYI